MPLEMTLKMQPHWLPDAFPTNSPKPLAQFKPKKTYCRRPTAEDTTDAEDYKNETTMLTHQPAAHTF